MRRLSPDPGPLEPADLYAGLTLPDAAAGRGWWLALCMVASLDGAAAAGGRSAPLGDDADRLALSRLRGACDAVLVGAATVRTEGYGPLVGGVERRADRRRRGLAAVPRLVIVTASAALDPDSAPFTHPDQRPLVLTTDESAPAARDRLGAVADVAAAGKGRVSLPRAVAHLAALGLPRICAEGGPRVNAQLVAEGLVDEVFLTVAPLVVGGPAPRIVQGPVAEQLRRLRLESVLEHDGELFLRYRRPEHPRP